jgi:hypothetical protein
VLFLCKNMWLTLGPQSQLTCAIFCEDLSLLDVQFFGIDHQLLGVRLDLGLDLDEAIIGPRASEFQIEEGQVIVGWFDAVHKQESMDGGVVPAEESSRIR